MGGATEEEGVGLEAESSMGIGLENTVESWRLTFKFVAGSSAPIIA